MKRSKRLKTKRRSRAFYRRRMAAKAKAKADAPQRSEAEALRPWRGWCVALAAFALAALAMFVAALVVK